MTDPVPSKDLNWMPFEAGVEYLNNRLMRVDPGYVLKNWECKYIEVRVDMRTGAMLIKPGNERAEPSKDQVRLDALEHRLLSEEQETRAADIEHKLRFGWAQKKAARLIVDLRDQVEASRRTAEHWKAEHLAGNAEIERLENHIINRPPLKVTCERCIGVIRELRDAGYHDWASRIERAAQPPASPRKVACETEDGLLKIHGEHESCDVCSPQPPGDGWDANGSPV